MEKIFLDRSRCIGSGMCTSIAPGTFELDADQELIVLHEVPPPGEEEAVRDAVVCCPVEALRLDDEGTRP